MLSFDKMAEFLLKAFRESLTNFTKQCGTFLMIYMVLTVLCTIFDFIAFFISLAAFSTDYTMFADCALLFLSIVFMSLDLYYFAWVFSSKTKFPSYASQSVYLGLIGIFKSINKNVDDRIVKLDPTYKPPVEEKKPK